MLPSLLTHTCTVGKWLDKPTFELLFCLFQPWQYTQSCKFSLNFDSIQIQSLAEKGIRSLPVYTSLDRFGRVSNSQPVYNHNMARRTPGGNTVPELFGAPPQKRLIIDPNESAYSRFMREEILAPQKLAGNISIITGVAVFAAGIFTARAWGDILVPA